MISLPVCLSLKKPLQALLFTVVKFSDTSYFCQDKWSKDILVVLAFVYNNMDIVFQWKFPMLLHLPTHSYFLGILPLYSFEFIYFYF